MTDTLQQNPRVTPAEAVIRMCVFVKGVPERTIAMCDERYQLSLRLAQAESMAALKKIQL